MPHDRPHAAGDQVQVRALCQLGEGESACFSGEVVTSDVTLISFSTGDLVAGFGNLADVGAVPPAELLCIPPDLGPEAGVMLPPLVLGMRAARLARIRRGERALLIGEGSVTHLVQVALEANGASVSMRSARARALTVDSATVAVDTTGDPAIIVRLFEEMPKMTRVILAGRGNGRRADVDLYRTIHQRGLEVIGVASFAEKELDRDLAAAEELLRAQGVALESTASDRLRRVRD